MLHTATKARVRTISFAILIHVIAKNFQYQTASSILVSKAIAGSIIDAVARTSVATSPSIIIIIYINMTNRKYT